MNPADQGERGDIETVTWSPASDTSTAKPLGSLAASPATRRLGDFDLLEEIGRGGMGVVFKARQRSADRTVALKVIRADHLAALSRDDRREWLDRFRIEAQSAAQIDHEHVVTVFDVGEVEGQPYYAMRYVDGHTLEEAIRRGPMANDHAAACLYAIAGAIRVAHDRGILHRDLKPANILIDAAGRPYVADFGLAKRREIVSGMTQTGDWLGSPSYMSPEQVMDSSRVSCASDIYGLGATLYALVTGRPPFRGQTAAETLHQVIHEEPVPPRQLNPAVDLDLQTICLKCLEKEPARRYESTQALADDLQRYLNQEPITARPTGAVERLSRWCRRSERVRDVGALTLAIAGVFAIWNLFGIAGLIFGFMPAEKPAQALIIVGLDFLGFVACLWIGLGTLARKKRSLWAGLAAAGAILAFVVACFLGLPFDAGGWLRDPAVRFPVLTFFGVLASVMLTAYVIALNAYYSETGLSAK